MERVVVLSLDIWLYRYTSTPAVCESFAASGSHGLACGAALGMGAFLAHSLVDCVCNIGISLYAYNLTVGVFAPQARPRPSAAALQW
jgi:hypothetical protein